MADDFFPFRLYSSSDHGYSPSGFKKSFQANRPEYIERVENKGTKFEWTRREKFSYYCYDVIILSQTEVEFVCFDMHDFCYGGKGKEIHRFRATVDKSVTKDYIERRLLNRGIDKRERELAQKELEIAKSYARDEMFELGISFKD